MKEWPGGETRRFMGAIACTVPAFLWYWGVKEEKVSVWKKPILALSIFEVQDADGTRHTEYKPLTAMYDPAVISEAPCQENIIAITAEGDGVTEEDVKDWAKERYQEVCRQEEKRSHD